MDFVLIVTLGQTDVSAVNRASRRRFQIHKDHQRRFHELCERGLRGEAPAIEVLSLRETRELRKADAALEYDRENRRFASGLSGGSASLDDASQIDCSGRSGPVVVCTPIIADLEEKIRELVAMGQLGAVRHVLLLTTRREAASNPQEPAAAGMVVARALVAAFDLKDSDVTEVAYLQAGDRNLYETDEAGQTHPCRAAARRIDSAIAGLRTRHPNAMAVIEDVGGIPGVPEVVAASCRYRFPKVRFVRITEQRDENVSAATVLVAPAESLEIRRRVAAMVRSGALVAAAAVWRRGRAHVASGTVAGLAPHRGARPQRRTAGRERHARGLGDRRGESAVLTLGPVLFSAIRVEESLRRGEWVVAIRETFAFYEAAENEILDRAVRRTDVSCFDWVRKRLYVSRLRPEVVKELPVKLRARRKPISQGDPRYRKKVLPALQGHVPKDASRVLQTFFKGISPAKALRMRPCTLRFPCGSWPRPGASWRERAVRQRWRFLTSPAVEAVLARPESRPARRQRPTRDCSRRWRQTWTTIRFANEARGVDVLRSTQICLHVSRPGSLLPWIGPALRAGGRPARGEVCRFSEQERIGRWEHCARVRTQRRLFLRPLVRARPAPRFPGPSRGARDRAPLGDVALLPYPGKRASRNGHPRRDHAGGPASPAIIDDLLRALADAGRAPGIGEDRVTFRLTRGGSALAALGLRTEDLPAAPRAVPGVVPRLGVGSTAPLFLQKRSRTARRLPGSCLRLPIWRSSRWTRSIAFCPPSRWDRAARGPQSAAAGGRASSLDRAHCYARSRSTAGQLAGRDSARRRARSGGRRRAPRATLTRKGTTGGGVYGNVPWALVLWGGLLHVGWHRVAVAGGWRLLLD